MLTKRPHPPDPSPGYAYTQPTKFQFSRPNAGPVTVASSASFNSIHLVTRAASPEQKSLIYVNGTEVSGHLHHAVTIPTAHPLGQSRRVTDSSGLEARLRHSILTGGIVMAPSNSRWT